MVANFKDEKEWSEYWKEVSHIRESMDRINQEYGSTESCDPKLYKERLEKDWWPVAESFVNKYSVWMVPLDLRWAMDDVGLELFDNVDKLPSWPPKIKLSMDENGEKSMVTISE